MRDKVFIDSNIFLYAFNKDEEFKYDISLKIILDKENNLSISTQVINEVSNNLKRKLKYTNSEIKKFIISSYQIYNIVNFSKDILLYACDIRDRYKISYYDSLIVASALSSKCTILYSENMQHQLKIDNLVILNPFKVH